MRARDAVSFGTITNAGTTTASAGTFDLDGGEYRWIATAGTWGTGGAIGITLPAYDGTAVPVITAATANNTGTVDLPACHGTITVTGTVTAGTIVLTRVPRE